MWRSANLLLLADLLAVTDNRCVLHLVTDDAMAAGRAAGCYVALCGCDVLAASLTEPERHHCAACRDRGAAR